MVGFGGLETFVRRFLLVRWPSQSELEHRRRRPVCEDCAFVQPNRQEPTDDQADLSSAPTHDRRHDDAQFVAEHPRDIHPCGSAIQYVPLAISRQARGRAFAGISPAPCIPRSSGQFHLREDERVEVLLPHDITAAGYRRADPDAPPIGSSTHCPRTRGGRAFAQGGSRSQAANGAHYDLLGGSAYLRGLKTDGAGYRQCTYGHLRPARQRGTGSLYGLIQAAARHSSRLLAPYPAAALAVSRPQSITASDETRVATGVSAGSRGRSPQEIGPRTHVSH